MHKVCSMSGLRPMKIVLAQWFTNVTIAGRFPDFVCLMCLLFLGKLMSGLVFSQTLSHFVNVQEVGNSILFRHTLLV